MHDDSKVPVRNQALDGYVTCESRELCRVATTTEFIMTNMHRDFLIILYIMFVCMCMYERTYACMFVRMYANVYMNVGYVCVCMYVRTSARNVAYVMYACVYVVYVRTYVLACV
jgi:hypothetical protein